MKHNVVLAGLTLLGLSYAYCRGREAGELRLKVAGLERVQDSLRLEAEKRDTVIVRVREEVAVSRAAVVAVDTASAPAIDSSLARLGRVLDSAGQVQLAVLRTKYDSRILTRDNLIADQDELIRIFEEAMAECEKRIALYEEEVRLLKRSGTGKKIAIGAAAVLGFLLGRM